MSQRKRKAIPNWSELYPDLLRCVFKRLSFIGLNRAKSVCSSWHSASRGCVPKKNQIPCLILFPSKEKGTNINNNTSSCVLFVPEDKDKVYKTRDLDVDLVQSRCLATYGSWLLMIDCLSNHLYILNPLSRERIDLPDTKSIILESSLYSIEASFWVDNKTKDYLVFWRTPNFTLFTKKWFNKWHDELPPFEMSEKLVYNNKNQKLYVYLYDNPVAIWDFSEDKPREDGFLDCFRFNHYEFLNENNLLGLYPHIAITVFGDVLNVRCYRMRRRHSKRWRFHIYKANHMKHNWVRIHSLGDEALILDMGVTVVAKDVPGIKRNSIYFSGVEYGRKFPEDIFVFDLTTQKIEPLPQCVYSSMRFSDSRWLFPEF